MGLDLKFTDNSGLVLSQLDDAVGLALEEVGLRAESHAVGNAPVGTPKSTGIKHYKGGSLKESIKHKVVGNTVFIGTNIKAKRKVKDENGEEKEIKEPYAVYVELGTGIHYEGEGGRHTAWSFTDKNGVVHHIKGMKPTHFLRNAMTKHKKEYMNAIKNKLKGK